jgi:hypothetical protein
MQLRQMDLLVNKYKSHVTPKSRPLYQYVLQSYGVVAQLPIMYFSCLNHLEQFLSEYCPQQSQLFDILYTPDFFEFSKTNNLSNLFYGIFLRLKQIITSLPASPAYAPACQLLQQAIPLMLDLLTSPEHDHHREKKLGLFTEILEHTLQIVNSDRFISYEAIALQRSTGDLMHQLIGPAFVRYEHRLGFAAYSAAAFLAGLTSIFIALHLLLIAPLAAPIGLILGILITSMSANTFSKNLVRTETSTEKNCRLLNTSITQLTNGGFFKHKLTKFDNERLITPDSPLPSYISGEKQNRR